MWKLTIASAFLATIVTASSAASACDLDIPRELVADKMMRISGWKVFGYSTNAMIDGRLFYRYVKSSGIPSGAAEQKLLQEHVGRVFTAAYGGKSAVVKIDTASNLGLPFQGATTPVRVYNVSITRPNNTPGFAAVIVRPNQVRRDITVIVTAIDPDSPDDNLDRPLAVAKRLAAHPGFDCSAGDVP